MDEIQNFYNKPENAKAYSIPPAALKVSDKVILKYFNIIDIK